MTRTSASLRVILAGSISASAASAQVIDFESVPFAIDDMKITNQYKQSHGVVFGIDNNHDLIADRAGSPRLERVGPGPSNMDGFWSSWNGTFDGGRTDRPERLGDWFLRTNVTGAAVTPNSLLIEYTSGGTYGASGQIWDIDGIGGIQHERWAITAFDSSGGVLASVYSPWGYTSNATNIYESGAFTWSFNLSPNGPAIDKIRIDFIGQLNGNGRAGLAFDNFWARGVPTPGAASMVLAGSLLTGRRRRSHADRAA